MRLKLWLVTAVGCCPYASECCHCHRVTCPVTTDAATLSQSVVCFVAGNGGRHDGNLGWVGLNVTSVKAVEWQKQGLHAVLLLKVLNWSQENGVLQIHLTKLNATAFIHKNTCAAMHICVDTNQQVGLPGPCNLKLIWACTHNAVSSSSFELVSTLSSWFNHMFCTILCAYCKICIFWSFTNLLWYGNVNWCDWRSIVVSLHVVPQHDGAAEFNLSRIKGTTQLWVMTSKRNGLPEKMTWDGRIPIPPEGMLNIMVWCCFSTVAKLLLFDLFKNSIFQEKIQQNASVIRLRTWLV